MNSYYESALDIKITRTRALAELKKHNMAESEIVLFDNEVKPDEKGLYLATDVLEWLGY